MKWFLVALLMACSVVRAGDSWADDPVWHDGLAEKAVYAATRVVYDKPRTYEAVFFTNKEQHDRKTLTKAEKSTDTVEVWKFNQVEVIPTPNYDYKYVTTSHLTVGGFIVTRMESSSQEFCGTSFKQYLLTMWPGTLAGLVDYFGFSYMPETGRTSGQTHVAIPLDVLPLYLRIFPFDEKGSMKFAAYPSQKSNRPTPFEPVEAEARYAGEEAGSYKLDVLVAGKPAGTYWMAKDRRHVMVKYEGADGQRYELKSVERVNYWTRKE